MKYVPDNEIPWDRSFGIIARIRMGDAKYAGRMLRLIPPEFEIGGNLDAPIAFDCDYCVCKGTAATAYPLNSATAARPTGSCAALRETRAVLQRHSKKKKHLCATLRRVNTSILHPRTASCLSSPRRVTNTPSKEQQRRLKALK